MNDSFSKFSENMASHIYRSKKSKKSSVLHKNISMNLFGRYRYTKNRLDNHMVFTRTAVKRNFIMKAQMV